MIDISAIRNDAFAIKNRIHLNNAGSSLPPHEVTNRVIEHLKLEESLGGYEAAEVVKHEVEDFYVQAAELINAEKPIEIAFAESATDAWQKFFYSVPLTNHDRIIVFENEYVSFFLSLLQQQKRFSCSIEVIAMNSDGDIDIEALKNTIDDNVKMVLLGHMPTQSGQLSPAEKVGAIVKKTRSLFILDATQTIGQYPVDVKKIGCHALCATGRKFLRGPRGTGFLYVREDIAQATEPSTIDLRAADWTSPSTYHLAIGCQRFESWEQSIALKLGLKEAIKYASSIGIENIWDRGCMLSKRLRAGLRRNPKITLCDPGTMLGNIVTFFIDGYSCHQVVDYLKQRNININSSLREYARLDFEKRNLTEVCRASVHYFNTEAEVDETINALDKLSS